MCAAGLAASLSFGTSSVASAQDSVNIKPKPLSATFKKIDTQSLRVDLVFNGKINGKVVKNTKLQFDVVEDRAKQIRIITFGGPALTLMVNDPSFARLGVRSMALIEDKGALYVQLQGAVAVCVKPPKNDKSLITVIDQLSADKLQKNAKLDKTTLRAKLVKSERIGTEPSKKYEVLDLQSIKDPNGAKQYMWIADKGEYISKFEVTVPTDGKDSFAPGFVGDQRVTYTILGINKPVKAILPASCKNAIQG
jgi:hypothetical protein